MSQINIDRIKNSTDLIKVIEAHGWVLQRTKGSHHTFKKEGVRGLVTIPHPKKDMSIGIIKAILKGAGVI